MKKKFAYVVALVAAAGLLVATAAAQQTSTSKASSSQSSTWKSQGTMGRTQGRMAAPNAGRWATHRPFALGLENPLSRSIATVYVLPDLHSQLGLSPSQVAQLSRLKETFLANERKDGDQIVAKREALDKLIGTGKATQEQVTTDVTEIANLEAHQQIAGYETALKMKTLLTPEQRTKLAAIQPAELWNTMASNLTVRDMWQMMRYMHGAAGFGVMGGPGMMGGRMMAGGGTMHGGMMGRRATPTP